MSMVGMVLMATTVSDLTEEQSEFVGLLESKHDSECSKHLLCHE